ncbi:MAG: twin-arginine translocase subunit TatC [Gemmatimonadota bacterium]
MASGQSPAEMPFLDHLEELRWRIVWCLAALVVGVLLGFVVVLKYDFISLLQEPIRPFLNGNKLVYTKPGDTFNIVLNVSLAIGVGLALPIIAWQVWAFLAPALFVHERKVIVPVLFGAIFLFVGGAAMAWFVVVPMALGFLTGFQSASLTPMITAEGYFDFVTSLVLAFGLAFELPIVLLALSAFGVVNARQLARGRRFALVGSVVAASVLTPGDLVTTTLAMAVPLYLLYEVSIALAWLIDRRRAERNRIAGAPA